MLPISESLLLVLPFFLLAISIITLFIKPKLSWYLFVVTLVTGFILKAIDATGILIIVALLTLSFYSRTSSIAPIRGEGHSKSTNLPIGLFLTATVICGCFALAAHLFPGFNNFQVLDDVTKNGQSTSFNLYLNFDKPLIIFILLLSMPSIIHSNKSQSLLNVDSSQRLFYVIILGFILLFTLAMSFSLIEYAPNLPQWWWIFAINNLVFTCISEEVLFRGFIQRKLCHVISPIIGLTMTSLLFGLAHFSGGVSYILVATIAGFLYGLVYLKTGKLSLAILTHFCLNMIHLSLFTYPLAK